jgi:hypothetical protein
MRRLLTITTVVFISILAVVSGVAVATNATAATNSPVAELTVYSDGSAIGTDGASGFVEGHSFIGVKNVSKSNITVGKLAKVGPLQTATLGTWGNREEHVGLWYNLEAYLIHSNPSVWATTSISRMITAGELRTLNSYIISHDSHGGDGLGAALNNCSTFAAGAWNSVAPFTFRVSAGIPNTPTGLAASIDSLPGAEYGKSVNIPWDLLGVWYAQGKKSLVQSTVYTVPTTKLTFDDLPIGTAVSDQYATKGMLISGSPGPVISEDGSNPTAPVLSPGPGYVGTIDINFVSTSNPSTLSTVSGIAFDIGYMDAEFGATVSWYSKTGKVLGQRSTTGFGIVRFAIATVGVQRVHIDTTADPAGAAIDNFEFSKR